jgi:hypothetical protein
MKFARRGSLLAQTLIAKKFVQQHGSDRPAAIPIDALDTYEPAGALRKPRRHRNVRLSPCFCTHWSCCRPKAAMKLNNYSLARLGGNVRCWLLETTKEKTNSTLHKSRINSVIVMTSERIPLLLASLAE